MKKAFTNMPYSEIKNKFKARPDKRRLKSKRIQDKIET